MTTRDERDRFMASLEAALKNAVQAVYDLEDMELAVTLAAGPRCPYLDPAVRGVRRRCRGASRHLAEDPAALRTSRPSGTRDMPLRPRHRRRPRTGRLGPLEDCEAACYDCLMSYSNQPDHAALDRSLIRDYLMALGWSFGRRLAHGRPPRASTCN